MKSEECRAWARRGRTTGGSPDLRVSDPNAVGAGRSGPPVPAAQRAKSLYTLLPARALRREGRPVRPWREAHSLSPCPDGQRQRLRTRKPDPIARVLHPKSDDTRCCPADSSWACPPGSRRIDVYSYKVPARPEAKSALQGRETGLARWWGHEVLKGPNTLTGVRAHRLGMQQRKLKSSYSCSCHTLSCCLPVLRSIGCRRCPHHRAPHGPQLRHKRPPTPLKRRAPAYAPHRADFGTVLITSSVLRPSVPWDCCWVRNWQCSTGGHLREG